MSIGEMWKSQGKLPSGFDYLRVALAVSVLLWHSCQMSYGTAFAGIVWLSPAGLLLQLILPMFFSLSGFLVTSSLDRSKSLVEFLLLRGIRIYPALLVEVALSALILGPLITTLPLSEYFSSAAFYSYLLNMTGYIHYRLPGVFENNPVSGIVNSSLWTVPFELECYILISLLVLLGYMRSRLASLLSFMLCSIALASWMTATHQSGTPVGGIHGRVLVLCFLAGSVLYRYRDYVSYNGQLALVTFVASVFLFRFDYAVFIGPIFAAYFTVWLGMQHIKRTFIVSSGDYSYGTYLYAGPIQQTIVWLLGAKNTYVANIAVALPLTIVFALFSWHAVERPFMRVKRLIRGRQQAPEPLPPSVEEASFPERMRS